MAVFDLTPDRLDVVVFRGDSLPMAWTTFEDATGQTFALKIWEHRTQAEVYDVAGVVTDTPTGAFTVALTAAQTAALEPATTYRWEVKRTAGADVLTLAWGLLTVQDNGGAVSWN